MSNLYNEIANLGLEDRTASEITGRALPPKLMAAVLMAEAAEQGQINVTNLDALMNAYYGNNLPATITQQKSKFKVFLDCGIRAQPAAATIRRAAQIIETKRAIVAEMSQGKDRDREQKAVDKLAGGVFEKATTMARLQSKAADSGRVMLSDGEILEVLSPSGKVSEDPLADGLEAMLKSLEKLVSAQGNFVGHDDIAKHITAALSHHQNSASVTPASNVAKVNTPVSVVAVQNNVVSLPAVSKAVVSPADDELEALLSVG